MTKPTSASHRLVAGCVALVYMAPVIYAALRYGQGAVQNLFAADAYYYFTIAKNTPGMLASFDGAAPTNGFHPLWQYLLIGLWRLVGAQTSTFLWAAFALNSAVAFAAVYVLAKAVCSKQRCLLLALFLVPGIFHLLVPAHGLYSLSLWRVLNGMETSLSLLFLALVVRRLIVIYGRKQEQPWTSADALAIGALTAMAVLSRLDNLALLGALPLYLFHGRDRARRAVLLLGLPLLAFGAYVAANLAAGLPALPVSGTTKSAFVLTPNLRVILDTLLSPLGLGLGITAPDGWRLRSRMLAALAAGCLISLALAGLSYVRTLRRGVGVAAFPAVLAPIVLFLAVRLFYYVAFIKFSHQGFWYYTDVAALLTAILLLQIDVRDRLRRPAWQLATICVWSVLYVHLTRSFLEFTGEHRWCPQLLATDAETITRCLTERFDSPKLLDSSDGVFSFYLDLPPQPGTALTATAAGHRLIVERGRAAYHDALVEEGYTIDTVSNLCFSGDVATKLKREPIRCGQNPALELFRLSTRP